jgi:glycosidase
VGAGGVRGRACCGIAHPPGGARPVILRDDRSARAVAARRRASLRPELTPRAPASKLDAAELCRQSDWPLPMRAPRFAALLFAPCAVWAAACGSSDAKNKDYGQPPDAAIFNPGTGSGGDGYGSGGQYDGGFVCPDEFKKCAHDFSLVWNGESSAEVRGDWSGQDSWDTGVPMMRVGNQWTASVNLPLGKTVQYKFVLNGNTWINDPGNPKTVSDGFGGTNSVLDPKTCDPSICEQPPPPPPGVFDWRDSVIYFVFVDRFFDGDPSNNGAPVPNVAPIANYQGGDWKGVTQKIGANYFNDLGVNTLWLTVPVRNANNFAGKGVGGDNNYYSAYHGYWPYDLDNPEPRFGTLQDLKDLVAAAHAKGIKVLFDYAMVHVQISSPVYQQNPGWFWPNSWNNGNCICGQGCSWDAQGDRCWFTDYLPHWNYTVPAARNYSVNNAVKWVKDTGADGFRLDAIKHVDISWLTQLRAQITSEVTALQTPKQRFYMVGETYDFYNRDFLKSFVNPKDKMDGQFDFPLRRVIVEAVLLKQTGMDALASFMDGNDFYYGANAIMSTWVGNHDLPRVIHLAQEPPLWGNQADGGKDRNWSNQPGLPNQRKAFEKLAVAFGVLATNRGAPLIYYGDEYGMPGAGDPDNRRFMQWSGYTADQQWLRNRVARLFKIRAAHPALRWGARTTLKANADLWFFRVQATTNSGTDEVYVGINRGDADQQVSGLPGVALEELVTQTGASGPNATIPARDVRIFVKK